MRRGAPSRNGIYTPIGAVRNSIIMLVGIVYMQAMHFGLSNALLELSGVREMWEVLPNGVPLRLGESAPVSIRHGGLGPLGGVVVRVHRGGGRRRGWAMHVRIVGGVVLRVGIMRPRGFFPHITPSAHDEACTAVRVPQGSLARVRVAGWRS